jgi:hypothetical protein
VTRAHSFAAVLALIDLKVSSIVVDSASVALSA